ncbi:MAG: sigma-70 family RNA polymerase sigma factor [Candidatus Caldatribacteriota bacterium]|nr:sigma-70 family RNA polymerase sigma factor [Candidatus Caldatribacteriota bacterium]
MDNNNEDLSVIESCLHGDTQAYALLVKKYERPVFNIIYRLTSNFEMADDITQETFLKAYRSLKQVKAEFKFSNWLFKIATNLCKDQFKKKKPVAKISLDESISVVESRIPRDNSLDPEEKLVVKEEQKQVLEAIESLPFIYRKIIVLRYIQDLAYKEIADILKMPMGRVKVQLHRAHKILRNELTNIL